MASPRLMQYDESRSGALCDFWNDTFRDRRHFSPLTAARWHECIEERPDFRPERLLLAVSGREVVGMVHVAEWDLAECRRRFRDWPRGSMGLVMMIAVRPERRGKGIGARLWMAGREALAGVEQVCLHPGVYDFTPPFWGTARGPAVMWGDSATKKFLAARGYGPRMRMRSMELDLSKDVTLPRLWVRTAELAPSVHGVTAMRASKAPGLVLLAKRAQTLKEAGVQRVEVMVNPETSREYLKWERGGWVKAGDWAAY